MTGRKRLQSRLETALLKSRAAKYGKGDRMLGEQDIGYGHYPRCGDVVEMRPERRRTIPRGNVGARRNELVKQADLRCLHMAIEPKDKRVASNIPQNGCNRNSQQG